MKRLQSKAMISDFEFSDFHTLLRHLRVADRNSKRSLPNRNPRHAVHKATIRIDRIREKRDRHVTMTILVLILAEMNLKDRLLCHC